MAINFEKHTAIREMYARAIEFLPQLRAAPLEEIDCLRVGLRPFRPGNVRLEQQPGTRLIHNYGHGGSGVTFSWGCALDRVKLVERVLCENAIQSRR